MAGNIDLATIFQRVTARLSEKKETLNEADTYNHDHGDHMVQIFDLVQNAVSKKSDKPAADQLRYASEVVKEKAHSGSAELYAQGLSKAANNLSGTELNSNTVSTLVRGLLNVEEPEQKQQTASGLGSLLSGILGGGEVDFVKSGFEVDDLLQAGLAFYQSKQEGDTNTEAIMDVLLAASPMGQSAHRKQSGSLVASTIMSFVQNLNQ
ncbi:MAG: hypothetical protein SVT56_09610 [Chloroflexota bacterium]|jgi:hypothetical protein|nr:hypothetical protein [Chloroflexota bacterium]